MSCNEWEQGSLILPAKAVKPVFDAILKRQNRLMDEAYAYTLDAYTVITQEKNTTAAQAFPSLVDRVVHNIEKQRIRSRSSFARLDILDATREAVYSMTHTQDAHGGTVLRRVPIKPQRKHFVKASASTTVFKFDETYVGFDRNQRLLQWNVSENNHAVLEAHESWLGVAMSHALSQVEWTRNTGGVFVKNDEYNQNGCDVDAGANYITMRYGPLGQVRSNRPGAIQRM